MWQTVASVDWPWWNIIVVMLSTALAVYALLPQRAVDALWAKFIGVADTNVKPAEEVGNVATSEPTDRIYTARTAGEFFAAVGSMTNVQIDNFIRPHLGKWLRVQSVIMNINQDDNFFYVALGRKFDPMPHLRFVRENSTVFDTMKQGDRIAVEGKITGLDHMMLYMDCCELVDLQEKDDVLRQY